MEIIKPKITSEGNYEFEESLSLGFIARSSESYYNIKTLWNKDLKLLSMIFREQYDMMFFFDKNGKPVKFNPNDPEHARNKFDYHRAIRGKNRHLKYLKIFLKLEVAPEKKSGRFISMPYFNWPLAIGERDLNKDGTPKFDQHKVSYTKETPEKVKLVEEYNARLKDWNENRQRLIKEIFEDKK